MLGWVVVRNSQAMPLTSWRPARRAPLVASHLRTQKFPKNFSVQVHGSSRICTNAVFLERNREANLKLDCFSESEDPGMMMARCVQ